MKTIFGVIMKGEVSEQVKIRFSSTFSGLANKHVSIKFAIACALVEKAMPDKFIV